MVIFLDHNLYLSGKHPFFEGKYHLSEGKRPFYDPLLIILAKLQGEMFKYLGRSYPRSSFSKQNRIYLHKMWVRFQVSETKNLFFVVSKIPLQSDEELPKQAESTQRNSFDRICQIEAIFTRLIS